MALLTTPVDTNRGTTGIQLPPQLSSEIWAGAQEESAVMRLAQPIALPGSGITIPVITGDASADWTAETAEKPVSKSTFGAKAMTPYKLAVIELFSNEFRRDLNALYAELVRRLPAAIGKKFDETVFNGTAPGSNFDVLTGSTAVAIGGTGTYGKLVTALETIATTDAELTKYRREYVGFIFQQYNLMPNLTAIENVQFIAELVKYPMSPKEAIAKVKLSDRENNYPGQLSGGQQQRVSIARAIVKNPKLILADEPTAALDYTTSIEVLSVIEDIVKNQGVTVMMVTHNSEIAKMADRVVKLRNGKIASIKRNLHPLHAEELVW